MSRLLKKIQAARPHTLPETDQTYFTQPKPKTCSVQKSKLVFTLIATFLFCPGVLYLIQSDEKPSTKATTINTISRTVSHERPSTVTVKTNTENTISSTHSIPPPQQENSEPESVIIFKKIHWNLEPIKNRLVQFVAALPSAKTIKHYLDCFAYNNEIQMPENKVVSSNEQEHLDQIHRILKKFHIEALRISGDTSRALINGQTFYLNTLVSQNPRLKWVAVNDKEMIFKDEHNQKYCKAISQDN